MKMSDSAQSVAILRLFRVVFGTLDFEPLVPQSLGGRGTLLRIFFEKLAEEGETQLAEFVY